jgi:stage III sporulation protein AB
MIKIIGAICIIIATSWIGFEASKALTERTRQIRILKSALQSLEAEIMYGHAPLT